MEEFVILFFGGAPEYPSEMSAHYEAYGKFMDVLNAGQHFKSGLPVENATGRQVTQESIDDQGAFLTQKNKLGGVMVIQAKDIDEAAKLCQHNPILQNGGRVIVHPLKSM
ncbi:MAG: YciI family protein [Salibacteraceae bacterium]